VVGSGDLACVEPVQFQRLAQREQMLFPPVAVQRLYDRFNGSLDARVAKFGQRRGVALAGEYRVENGKARRARYVADHVVNLQIHLRERLMKMLDMLRSHLHQWLPVPQDRTHGTDLIFRPEGGAQQSD
jgi:hypothetical protein